MEAFLSAENSHDVDCCKKVHSPIFSFLVPFHAVFLGGILAFAGARFFIGNPAMHGPHGGSQIRLLTMFIAAIAGQFLGGAAWILFSRAPASALYSIAAGILAGFSTAMIMSVWSEIDLAMFLQRDSVRIRDVLGAFLCCGGPAVISGGAFTAIGAVVLKAWRS